MQDNIITGIFTIGGTILGFSLKFVFDYIQNRRSRKDQYFFALLEKRFEAYQKAFALSEKLKRVIHKDDGKIEVVNQAKDWFNNYNLYLAPDIRQAFSDVIHDVSFYELQLDGYKSTGMVKGWDNEETKKKRDELNNTFKNIMTGIQKRIQDDIDLYYKYMK